MSDFIIVPRAPTSEQIRYAATQLLKREPTEQEYSRLHQVYQDMTRTGIPFVEAQQAQGLNLDPDSLLNQVSE